MYFRVLSFIWNLSVCMIVVLSSHVVLKVSKHNGKIIGLIIFGVLETFIYILLIISFMITEVSNKVIVVLLVLAFIFSIGGTFIIYDSVNNYKESMSQSGMDSKTTGMVSLNVVEDYSEGEENKFEDFE